MSQQPDMGDLSKEFSSLNTVARTDYELLSSNLAGMEEECKTSLGYLRLSHVLLPDTRELVSTFLTNAAERILSMQVATKYSALEVKICHQKFPQYHQHPPEGVCLGCGGV